MSNTEAQQVLSRISAALDRIERSASAMRASPTGDNTAELAALQGNHQKLRAEAHQALSALDYVIQKMENGALS